MKARHVKATKPQGFREFEKVTPATENQRVAIKSLENNTLTVLEGLAGTGKTYLAVNIALGKLLRREVSRVIFTRPLINVDNEKLGFLPGEVNDKTAPYAAQLKEYLEEFMPMMNLNDTKLFQGVEFVPLAYIRGRNFANSIIILDEAQNTSVLQMKTLLTRVAEGTQIYVLGDVTQSDVERRKNSDPRNGLEDLIIKLYDYKPEGVGHVCFGFDDIQRSEFVKIIMKLYNEI